MDVREALLGSKVAVWKGGRSGTVNAPEIRDSPVEVGSLSHYLQGCSTSQIGISGPSTVGTTVDEGFKCTNSEGSLSKKLFHRSSVYAKA